MCHAPGAARQPKAAPLAAESDLLIAAAVTARSLGEPIGEDAAL
jgi:hypothetical protein